MNGNAILIGLILICSAEAALSQRKQNDGVAMNQSPVADTVTLGGGCFWCLEAVYERVPGVISVVSGYAGGGVPDPSYELVCTGTTGHAEVVQISFNPATITFPQILDLFWQAHDPTTVNRQGADVGSQYRSVIFYRNEDQRRIAEISKKSVSESGAFSDPVVTEIVPLKTFYRAEAYHQDYFANNPNAPYCLFVIRPKLMKLDRPK
jgi:peptide-methionine (S)-S-oxide reductase